MKKLSNTTQCTHFRLGVTVPDRLSAAPGPGLPVAPPQMVTNIYARYFDAVVAALGASMSDGRGLGFAL